MKKLRICVYAICKNEAKFVDEWMDSMGEADLVVVTDTGSEDDTVQRLKERGALVYQDIIRPWRFDVARNVSLAHVPQDIDICVCTDLDERFNPGWRAQLEDAWTQYKPAQSGPIAKTGRYLYNWSLKPDGTPDVQFYYFKVHERQGFEWRCPVHEYVSYTGSLPLELVYIQSMVLSHYPDQTKSRSSYLPLLELAVQEAPTDERMRYYLGREYMYQAQWQKSIDTLEQYLNMPNAMWNEERCAAMRWMAKGFQQLGKPEEAYSWFYRAVAEAPHMRDPYVEFARVCYERADWFMVFFLGQTALKIANQSKTFVNMGYAWDHTLDDLCAIAAYHMGMKNVAKKHAKAALAYSPDDVRLQNNVLLIEKAKQHE